MDIQWYPGHMAKAKRLMLGDLDLVDMLIEVVDARAPKSSRNPDLVQYTGKKAHVIVLNKSDLAEDAATAAWLKIYRRAGFFACKLNAAQKQGTKELLSTIDQAAEPMRQKMVSRGRIPRPVRAMVVGIPNCGKSTIINALSPRGSAKTGNTPGVTRGRQWVKAADGMELLDTPGVLWPKFASETTAFNLAVIGSISDQVFPVYQVAEALALYLALNKPQYLLERYKLSELPSSGQEILELLGQKRGLLSSGGVVRSEDAARLLLTEFKNGKLGKITLDNASVGL